QNDVNLGRVTYQHDGTPTISDAFDFDVDDGQGTVTSGTFGLMITLGGNEESLDVNLPLSLNEGATSPITSAVLSTSDPDTTPSNLIYTITGGGPGSGTVLLSGAPTLWFTQDDINNSRVEYQHDGSETTSDSFDFDVDDGQGGVTSDTFLIDVAPVNDAPVLRDAVVALDPITEDAGPPSGAVGTLVSDLVDLSPSSLSVMRTDVIPFYSASSGDNSKRWIGWWWSGWDEWATHAKLSLEKHGSLWMHLPYGRITPGPMDFDGRSDAANGVPPHHGPLPHISDGLEHYLEQVVTPEDQLFFYFGAPSLIYTSGMTYADYELAVMTELSDVLGLADDAKVSIGFDATYGQPTSLGGIWTVLGGPTGYNAQLLQSIASQGVNVILEPWIYKGASWAYDYDTISTESFYQTQELDEGDLPKSVRWENRALRTGDHYRVPNNSDVVTYYGGDWENAVVEILAIGDIPLGRSSTGAALFVPSWVEFPGELIDPATLVPLPGYNPPSGSSLQQDFLGGNVPDTLLFSDGSEGFSSASDPVTGSGDLTRAAVLDNVDDTDNLLTGVAIVGADTTNGTWWYTTDGGDNWNGLGSVSTGSARLLASNSLTRIYFQPNAEYSGTIANAVTFQAWDQSGGAANGTAGVDVSSGGGASAFSAASDVASIVVLPMDDAPTINPVSDQIGVEDTVLGPIALVVGDVDTPVASLIVSATSNNQTVVPDGNLLIGGSGANRTLTVTPALHQNGGPVTISVSVSDGVNTTVEDFMVTFTPQPDPPVANNDSVTVIENTTLSISPLGPLANDFDPDGDSLSMIVVSGPTQGTLLPQPDGSFLYTPAPDYVGPDQFSYVAHDGTAPSNVAVVRIAILPGLVPPPPPAEPPPDTTPPDDPPSEDDPPEDDPPSGDADPPVTSDPLPTDPPRKNPIASAPPLSDAPSEAELVAGQEASAITSHSSELPISESRLLRSAGPSDDEPAVEFADGSFEDLQFVVEAGAFWDDLDELEDLVDQAGEIQHLAGGAVLGVSSGLTAGYVLWLVRGGYLLSSVLAQMPAWRFIDPLPILDYLDEDDQLADEQNEQDSLAGMLAETSEPEISATGPGPDGSNMDEASADHLANSTPNQQNKI
ncbi:MAG: cadherin-like domain-containing protein, partial [Aeoliella sp.]